MSIKKWATRIANDVYNMTLEGDLNNETIVKNILLSITDTKYHQRIENLFGIQNYYDDENILYC